MNLSTRFWEITTEFVGYIPHSLVSIVLGWILIYRNCSIKLDLHYKLYWKNLWKLLLKPSQEHVQNALSLKSLLRTFRCRFVPSSKLGRFWTKDMFESNIFVVFGYLTVLFFFSGAAAQEIVKLVTHQFVPFNNTYIYNGITGSSTTLQLWILYFDGQTPSYSVV